MFHDRQSRLFVITVALVGAALGCTPGEPIVILPDALPSGVVGWEYTQDLTATTLEAPTWRIIAGALPAGLALDEGTGEIRGVPGASGSFEFTVVALGRTLPIPVSQADYTLTIIPPLTASNDPPTGRVGQVYQHTFSAEGGVPPYSYSLVGLPAGLSFDGSTATISGTPVLPLEAGRLDLTVTDAGSPQQQITAMFTLAVKPAPVRIATTNLPDGNRNVAYVAQLTAENGAMPYRWAIVGGLLPNGLRLNQTTGAITGTPTDQGSTVIDVRVTDNDSPPGSDTKSLSLTIEP